MSHPIKILLLLAAFFSVNHAQAQTTGEIRGRVFDAVTNQPLFGIKVMVADSISPKGAITDTTGQFLIQDLDFGTYTLIFRSIGYQEKEVSDVAIYDFKGIYLEIGLTESSQNLGEVVVSAYKNPVESIDPLTTVSARSISIEETKRFAGSLGDPSRMALSYSGVSTGGGDNNELIIRGNSAKYLQWKLEGLEIPNPNHFGVHGSSGGFLSILNGNNLGRSNFYLGAFPAHTGNALAGVFDLTLRNGNSNKFKHSFETSLIGLSASSEGPIKSLSGANYIFNYRFSTLGLMKKLGVFYQAPEYQDLTFKVNLPTQKAGKFTIYGLGGLGTSLEEEFFRQIDSSQFSLNSSGDTIYGFNEISAENLNKYNIGVVGIKHSLPIKEKFILTNHMNYSIVYSAPRSSGYNASDFSTYLQSEGRFTTSTFRYQPQLTSYIGENHQILSGAIFSYRLFNSKLIEGYQDNTTKTILDANASSSLVQSYISYKYQPGVRFKLVAGLHYTYFNLNDQHLIEPRLGLNYKLSEKAEISFASGLHSTTESPEVYFYINDTLGVESRNLKMARSWQSVFGYKRQLGKKLHFSAEVYFQHHFDIPIATDSSNYSLINEEVSFTDLQLTNKGKGINYGIDFTLEKHFSKSYYFLFTTSIFQSEYSLSNPLYRKTNFNSGYVFNLLGGKEFKFKKNRFLGINLRANLTGGKLYTPVLLEESINAGYEIKDEKITNIDRLPPYIGIDISINYKWIRPKVSHEIKLDIFRLFEQNYYGEIYVPEKLNSDGSITPAFVKQLKYGDGQTASTILPVLYYRINF